VTLEAEKEVLVGQVEARAAELATAEVSITKLRNANAMLLQASNRFHIFAFSCI
jgi:hypothetical protein